MTSQGFLGELYVTIGVDSSGLANATVAVTNMQRATQTATNAANNALNSTGVATKKLAGNINNSMNSISNNLYRFGTFATMAFTLPLAALATLGVKSAVELEQIKAKTVALANVSQEQMDAWSGAITRIGIATNATSKSIAQSLYFVSSAGVDNANAMKMVEFAAKGSAAGLGETDVIAKLLTYTYNAYGKEAFDVVKIMDSLTVAVREGAAEAGDIVAVMGDLIPIGAQLGVSFAQMAGSLAAMTQVGMNAHKSATALRQIMVQLIKPHHDAAAALDKAAVKMGDASIASRNLTATIRDKGLLETLVMIKEAGEKMGPMFLPTVFSNVRAFNGFMAEVGPNLEKVRLIMKKTTEETGAFATALGIMTQTSEFKLGQFKKAWELAMIGLGESILPKLLPMLNSLVQTINDLTTWFKSLSSTTQGLILDFGVFLALLGPFTIAASGLVRLWAILGMAMTGMIIPAIHGVGTALVWLSGIMLANPYIVMGVAIAALTYGIYSLATASKELTVAQKVLNDVHIQAAQSTAAEKVAIGQLMRVATSANATLDQKQKAIKTINLINPEYLEGINQETIRTGEATAAIGRYIQSLELKAKKQAIYDAMVETERKRAMALASGSDKELSIPQKIGVGIVTGISGSVLANSVAEKLALENSNKAAKDFTETMRILNIEAGLVPLELQRIEQASVKVAKVLYPSGNKKLFTNNFTKENVELINKATKAYERYLTQYNVVKDMEGQTIDAHYTDGTTKRLEITHKLIEDARLEMEYFYKIQQKVFNNSEAEKSPLIYMTTAKYIWDMVDGMTKYSFLVNNSKPEKKKDSLLPEDEVTLQKAIEGIQKTFAEGLAKIKAMKAMYGKEIDFSGLKFNEQEELLKTYGSAIESLAGKMDKSTPYYVKIRKEFEALAVAQRAAATSLSYMNPDETTTNIGNKPLAVRGGGVQMTDTSVYLNRITETTAKYTIAAREAALTGKVLGASFDTNSALIKINDDKIKDLVQIYIAATGNASAMAFAQEQINAAMQTNVKLTNKDILKQYNDELIRNQKQYELSHNSHRKYIVDLQSELEKEQKLLTLLPLTSLEYAKQAEKVAILQVQLSKTSGLDAFNKIFSDIGQGINSILGEYINSLDIKKNAAYDMIDSIAKMEGRSAEWIAKKKAGIDAEYTRNKKRAAIAEATLNMFIGISSALKTPWMIPFITALGLMQIANIKSTKMATGGVIPSGYNNDTYPALLSSGETVIPASPHKLSSNMLGAGNQTIQINGRLVADGKDLVYVFDKEYKLMKSY